MPSSSPSPLIVRLDAIGDAVTLAPTIAALREHGMSVAALLSAANVDVFLPEVLERIVAPFHQRDASKQNRRAVCEAGRAIAGRFTHALIASEDPAAYRYARAADIQNRIGFENGWGKPLKSLWVRSMCTQTIRRTAGLDRRGLHECAVIFELARALLPSGAQTPRDVTALRPLLLRDEPLADGRIAIQLTEKWQRFAQPPERVGNLITLISERHGVRLIASTLEGRYAMDISTRSGLPVDLFSSLEQWKRAIAAARAYVAPDSGGIHLAGMLGTPCVAAYEAISALDAQVARWSPWASPYRAIPLSEGWTQRAATAVEELLRTT